jgi:hypothetical protein
MPAKGSTKTCCCGGCSTPPWELAFADVRQRIQPLQQYCCACIPLQLCVHYVCPDDQVESFALFDAVIYCDAEGTEAVQYAGDIIIDGALTRLEFYFDADTEYGTCDFCLTSSDLGIYGECKEITDEVRAELCPRCTPCPDETDILAWDISTQCSGTATISVRPAANTSLTPHPRCCNCPDPCDDEPYLDLEPYPDESCGGLCAGCGCICSRACITVVRNNQIFSDEVVDLCNWAYHTSGGIIISIVLNESTGCCELELTSAGAIEPDAPLTNVTIGGISNPCPNPVGRWEFNDAHLTSPDDQVVVIFECATCDGCPGVVTSTCCPGAAVRTSRVLSAEAVGSVGCCGTINLLLVFDEVEGAWIGSDENSMCGHAIGLRLNCGADTWSLTFSGAPCNEVTVEAEVGGTCDPLNLEFQVPLTGLSCCSGALSGTLVVTVTE